MNEYTFEMVPGLVGRIAELLESIDSKLDKVNVAPIPTDDTPELMNVKDLGRYLPSHPAPSTVYGWVNDNTIPTTSRARRRCSKSRRLTSGCFAPA